MIATNAFLVRKVGKFADDVEMLNRAYQEAIESFRGVTDLLDSMPEFKPRNDEPEEDF
jgi:hypothetical protein